MQEFSPFTTIGIISRRDNRDIIDSLQALTVFFLAHPEIEIVLDESASSILGEHGYKTCARSEMKDLCQLVIVVGGDGSMLKAATVLAKQNIPVVGINRGRLGFLTDILPEELEQGLTQILEGKFQLESRFLLEVSTETEAGQQRIGSAMNDVVLHPGIAAQMIEFELYIDNEFVYNQASDGLIVATPTGSTAYSMSAGGPIMHPKLDAVVLVPMYPHSLSSRPIVVDSNSEITIVIGERHNTTPQVSCDGSVEHTTAVGDRITIKKQRSELKLLHPLDYNYYETCRSKLGWSHRPGNN